MDCIENSSQLIAHKLDSMQTNNEESITIQLELSSNETSLQSNSLNNNLGSLLIPGYLLVKSSSESGTYQLQQTVMQINVESDCNSTNIESIDGIDLSTITSCIDLPDIESRTSITGSLEQIVLTSNDISNKSNGITGATGGVTTRSKTKKSSRINTNKKKTEKINDKTKDSLVLITSEKVNYNNNVNELFDKNKSKTDELVVEEKDKTIRKSNQTEMNGQKTEKRLPPSRLVRVNCPVCNKEFKKTYLKEHMKIHEEDKPYKCLTCGKTYRWRTLLRNHKKTHLANNPFTCPVCDLRMSSKFSVQQHVLKVHENAEKKFQCSKCTKKYVTIHQLKAHEKFHSEDRTRQCEYCGKVYKHIASLERHRRLHKGEENSLDLRLKCSSCGLICHSKTHYTAHQRIHTGEKPFVCETCGKRYRQIAQLNQHKIVHTDLRPFKCTICERTFRCRSNLQLHMDHHRGEKRHTCSYCSQKFFSYPNMLKHIRRNHLGLRPYKCELCENKSFCEKQELQNHMRTHTGEKRPTPKRKRLPLPVPASEDKSIDLEQVHVLEVMPSNDSTETTITILDPQNNTSFANFVEPAIIYEIRATD